MTADSREAAIEAVLDLIGEDYRQPDHVAVAIVTAVTPILTAADRSEIEALRAERDALTELVPDAWKRRPLRWIAHVLQCPDCSKLKGRALGRDLAALAGVSPLAAPEAPI